MAIHRSPNCPQITFKEAIGKGRRVYDKEHTHAAPKAAVAEDLGYAGINGRSLSIIGALRQYGILEGNSEGLRITEDAVTYYELEEGAERNDAMDRMIFAPVLFESLRQQFGNSLPSESTLKFHLIKLGFLPKAADEVMSVYRENLELVKASPKRYTEEVPANVSEEPRPMNQTFFPNAVPLPAPSAPAGALSFSFPLSIDTKADLHIRGAVSEDELDMLRDQIEMTIKALKRSQARTSPPSISDVLSNNEGR
jgi:hypothetical protein